MLNQALIIPKELILDHIKLYFLKKTCGNCKHLCTRVDWDGFRYTGCSLAREDFIITRNDRKKYSCIEWKPDKNTLDLLKFYIK